MIKELEKKLLFILTLVGDKFTDPSDFNYFVCTNYINLSDEEKVNALRKAIRNKENQLMDM